MSIAGHVSRAMLSRSSHVRMEAKRRALDEIAARQRAADEQRNAEAEQKQQVQVAAQSSAVISHPAGRPLPLQCSLQCCFLVLGGESRSLCLRLQRQAINRRRKRRCSGSRGYGLGSKPGQHSTEPVHCRWRACS